MGAVVMLIACAASAPASALSLSLHLQPVAIASAQAEVEAHAPAPRSLRSIGQLDVDPLQLAAAGNALKMLGTRYHFGASDGESVDCSGLVQQAYRAAGIDVPRTTAEQFRQGKPVSMSQIRKGDLLFYRWRTSGLHVAVYVEGGYILHASPRQGQVVLTRLNRHWQRRIVAARRVA